LAVLALPRVIASAIASEAGPDIRRIPTAEGAVAVAMAAMVEWEKDTFKFLS
jgi:hypothetical protein